jgi:hypothetical protein
VLWPHVDRAVAVVHGLIERRLPRVAALTRRPAVRAALLSLAGVALAVAAVSVLYGPIRIRTGDFLFRSSGILRPALVAFVLAMLAGGAEPFAKALIPVLMLALLPIPQYRQSFDLFREARHPLRTARDCVQRLQARGASRDPALYVDAPNVVLRHEDFYYFRRLRPWERPEGEQPSDALLSRRLFVGAEQRPALVGTARYWEFTKRHQAAPVPLVSFDDVLLLLPGPYAACAP